MSREVKKKLHNDITVVIKHCYDAQPIQEFEMVGLHCGDYLKTKICKFLSKLDLSKTD